MRTFMLTTLIVAAFALASGCAARDADTYRTDTRSLLQTRNDSIKNCYDVALATDPNVSGDVAVNFIIEKKTGKIMNTAIDAERTTAPEALGACIVEAIDGLTLDPVDKREGQASFIWRFKANPPVPAA